MEILQDNNLFTNKVMSPRNIYYKEVVVEVDGYTVVRSYTTDGIEQKIPQKYEACTNKVPIYLRLSKPKM